MHVRTHTHLLVVGEPLGVDEPETAATAPCLAVRGRLLPALSPPLSLRLSPAPLLGSELGVVRRGVPELLRRRSMSLAGARPGEATLEGACTVNQPANYILVKQYIKEQRSEPPVGPIGGQLIADGLGLVKR